MNTSGYSTIPRPFGFCSFDQFDDFITADTTVAEFDKECENHPFFQINAGNSYGITLLAVAAKKGNCALIDHIINLGGKSLLSHENCIGHSPIHCTSLNEDPDRAYLAAKKLIQLGTPVNIISQTKSFDTPLDAALMEGKTRIASLLLRIGGIARDHARLGSNEDTFQITLAAARNEIMIENQKLLLTQTGLKMILPNELILTISDRLLRTLV